MGVFAAILVLYGAEFYRVLQDLFSKSSVGFLEQFAKNGLGLSPTRTVFSLSPVRNIGFFVDCIFRVASPATNRALTG
jgi:hypothetical protein